MVRRSPHCSLAERGASALGSRGTGRQAHVTLGGQDARLPSSCTELGLRGRQCTADPDSLSWERAEDGPHHLLTPRGWGQAWRREPTRCVPRTHLHRRKNNDAHFLFSARWSRLEARPALGGLNSDPPKTHVHLEPANDTLSGNRVFACLIKSRRGQIRLGGWVGGGDPESSMPGVLRRGKASGSGTQTHRGEGQQRQRRRPE